MSDIQVNPNFNIIDIYEQVGYPSITYKDLYVSLDNQIHSKNRRMTQFEHTILIDICNYTTGGAVLSNKLSVSSGDLEVNDIIAIWDSGCTITMISEDIINQLNLKSIGSKSSQNTSGVTQRNLYRASIKINDFETEVDVLSMSAIKGNDVKVLIGTDIISKGKLIADFVNNNAFFQYNSNPDKSNQFSEKKYTSSDLLRKAERFTKAAEQKD